MLDWHSPIMSQMKWPWCTNQPRQKLLGGPTEPINLISRTSLAVRQYQSTLSEPPQWSNGTNQPRHNLISLVAPINLVGAPSAVQWHQKTLLEPPQHSNGTNQPCWNLIGSPKVPINPSEPPHCSDGTNQPCLHLLSGPPAPINLVGTS
jgi:hypothetical protein